jgi:hypothetical protein
MKARKSHRKSGAIKTAGDLYRIRAAQNRLFEEKIKESDNRRKLMENMDPETAAFTRREFAKLGLF